MDAQQDHPQIPDLKFRVLIIGRANAGKTTILQKVCDTAEEPNISRLGSSRTRDRDHRVQLNPTIERGMHNIEDELVFTKHEGYVFHDSCGFECGSQDEVNIVQDFVRRKSREDRLTNRLHAIWYCIPMDNDRPELDLKHFDKICPDKNVPVIAVFTKYDQFRHDIEMKLEDENRETDLDAEVEKIFDQHYLASLGGHPPFVRLERMHKPGQRCTDLIEMTANALSGETVALMLMAVQKDNLELSIKYAIKWVHTRFKRGAVGIEEVIKACIQAFPSIWPIKILNEDFSVSVPYWQAFFWPTDLSLYLHSLV